MLKTAISMALLFCTLQASTSFAANDELESWRISNKGGESWRESWPEVEPLSTTMVANDLYMVHGVGGTVAVLTGPQGTLLVDSGHFRVIESRLFPIVDKLSKNQPVRYIINTHGHGDHGAGNTHYLKQGAIAIAHPSVRDEFVDAPPHYPPLPPEGLPQITLKQSLTLHFNNQDIDLLVVPFGHSKGDLVVYFRKQNVVHTGDIFITSGYVSVAGMYKDPKGAAMGLLAAQKKALSFGDKSTRYITGHSRGVVLSRSEIEKDHRMLATVLSRIQNGIDKGLTLDEIKATHPTKEFDEIYSWPGMSPKRTVENYYYGIVGSPPAHKRRFK